MDKNNKISSNNKGTSKISPENNEIKDDIKVEDFNDNELEEKYNVKLEEKNEKIFSSDNKIYPENKLQLKKDKSSHISDNDSKLHEICHNLLRSNYFTIFMTALTIFALFGDDFRLIATKSADDGFFTMALICLIFFSLEVMLQWYVRPDYRWGFYFYLDFISTLSLIPDIGWWADALALDGDTSALKAGRASRAGTRAGRIVKIVRLVRLVRIARLYRIKNEQLIEEEEDEELKTLQEQIDAEPSKVGKKLTELTTRRVLMIVLVMVMVLPFLEIGEYTNSGVDENQIYGLHNIHRLVQDWNKTGEITNDIFRDNFERFTRTAGVILYIEIYNKDHDITKGWLEELLFQKTGHDDEPYILEKNALNGWNPRKDLMEKKKLRKKYRELERPIIEAIGCYNNKGVVEGKSSDCKSIMYVNDRETVVEDAALNIGKTLFIMIALVISVLVFTEDASTLVIEPIERMVSLIQRLASDPFSNISKVRRRSLVKQKSSLHESNNEETELLERVLTKIGELLQVGFGSAGAENIAKNLQQGELDVMVPGKRITGVFGFGIIENFGLACVALEEATCLYINTIALIVHSGADTYYGAANKNIGSAFLLVWKICDGLLPGLVDPRDAATDIGADDPNVKAEITRRRSMLSVEKKVNGLRTRSIEPQEIVDSALASILKIRLDLAHANNLPENEEGSFKKFTNNSSYIEKNGADSHIELGFGLHIGWAVEGAIGSKYKIDASYLSPNVNMAARLEAATGQFGCSFLMSGFLVNELSVSARTLCRKIDVVAVKGSEIPMEIWTYDIANFSENLDLSPKIDQVGRQIPVDFLTDERWQILQDGIPAEFFQRFKRGVENYLQGEWKVAKESLEYALKFLPDDGPTNLLLDILKKNDYTAPSDWNGFRKLTSK